MEVHLDLSGGYDRLLLGSGDIVRRAAVAAAPHRPPVAAVMMVMTMMSTYGSCFSCSCSLSPVSSCCCFECPEKLIIKQMMFFILKF